MVEVRVDGLALDIASNSPVVILKPVKSEGVLPIWIGHYEAWAIAMEMSGFTSRRPLTHDLFLTVFGRLNVAVDRVVIHDLRDNIYYAVVHLRGGSGPMELDARPSDAIALAVRARAPVLVEDRVFDKSGGDDGSP